MIVGDGSFKVVTFFHIQQYTAFSSGSTIYPAPVDCVVGERVLVVYMYMYVYNCKVMVE